MIRRGWFLGAALALQPALANAAIFVLVDGIQGTVTQPPYAGWHSGDQFDWTFDRSNPALPFDLTITLTHRGASIASIKQAAFGGSTLRRIVIDNAHMLGTANSLMPLTRLTCEDAVIRKIGISNDADDAPISQLHFACGRLGWEDFEYQANGTFIKSAKGSWNFRTNTP